VKSILFGNQDQISRVFPQNILRILYKTAGLESEVISKPSPENKVFLADVDVIFSTWGMPELSVREIKEYFPCLKAVFYAAGSVQGFARPFLNCGVRVFSAWAANAVPVAEYTLAQILLANKNFYTCSRFASVGDIESSKKAAWNIVGNYGCKVGIIGAGMIGSMVIERLKQHDLEILLYDPFLPDERANEWNVTKVTLEQLFGECQTISNHCANNARTVGMLHYNLFQTMLPYSVFINTGRGAQVAEDDLCRILKERTDITAVLDVTWPEPPKAGHPFYTLENVVLTPHIAGSMGREAERMSLYMLEEFQRFIDGNPVLYEVTQDMLATMA
jgi:phosphoglycerate dehydrogenase-like enzyme